MKARWAWCLLALAASAAGQGVEFLPAGSNVVMGVNVRRIASTIQEIAPEAKTAGADWLKMASLAGIDPLRSVDEVLIASPATGPDAPALVVARGTFATAIIGSGQSYHGVPYTETGTGSKSAVALVDTSTLLAGDPVAVRAAIDRRSPPSPALAARVEALRSRYDIWGFGDRVPEAVASSSPAGGLESVDRFEFGLLMTNGLEITAEIHAAKAADAEKLAASLTMIEAAVKSQPPAAGAPKIDIRREDNTFRLSLAIPEAELKKAADLRRAAQRTVTPSPGSKTEDARGNTVMVTLPGGK